ncbi:MAG: hypothetical protein H0X40_01905 [Chthoniobacterales bacterium]|nr:hypothetical protein [Chthoniobacterales bacterium]
MDAIGLQTLQAELQDDIRVALDASDKATERFARGDEIAREACAHQLCRLYNAIEQLALRIAKAFENNIDDEQGWHSALLGRLSIAIPGVRPAFFPTPLKAPLRELRAFRHVFVHAYELEFDPAKLGLLLKYAKAVADQLPEAVTTFMDKVSKEQGLE